MCMCTICMLRGLGDWKKNSDLLVFGFQVVMSHHVDTGN